MAEKIKLGGILLDAGIIQEDHIEKALVEQKESGLRFGEALLKLGAIKAENIVWALSQQLNIPLIHVSASSVDMNAIALVPIEIAKKHTLIPYLLMEDELTIIIDDPFKEGAVEEVQAVSRRKVNLAVGMADEILAILDEVYEMASSQSADSAAPGQAAKPRINIDKIVNEIIEKPVSMIDLDQEGMSEAIGELGQRKPEGISTKLSEIFFAEPKLRIAVVKSLARIGGKISEKILIPAAKFQENFTSMGHIVSAYNRDYELRDVALKGLGDLGTKNARSTLKLMIRCWAFPLFRIFVFPIFKMGKIRPMIDTARNSLVRVEMRLHEAKMTKDEEASDPGMGDDNSSKE
jgi:MshEN domain